jgi:DNA modification methylase
MKPYYQDESCTIYHGDCREILPQLEPVDLVLTDPPYGIQHVSGYAEGKTWAASWGRTAIANDHSTEARDWALQFLAGTPAIVFGSWKIDKPTGVRQVLIFDKGPAFGMGDLSFPWKNSFEEIYVIGDGYVGTRDEAVLRGHLVVTWESSGRHHPNAKPVSLMAYLMSKHPGSTILDPFMGSGTTLRAAKDLGRKAIGIEIEEKYCEIAVKRLAQEVLPLH